MCRTHDDFIITPLAIPLADDSVPLRIDNETRRTVLPASDNSPMTLAGIVTLNSTHKVITAAGAVSTIIKNMEDRKAARKAQADSSSASAPDSQSIATLRNDVNILQDDFRDAIQFLSASISAVNKSVEKVATSLDELKDAFSNFTAAGGASMPKQGATLPVPYEWQRQIAPTTTLGTIPKTNIPLTLPTSSSQALSQFSSSRSRPVSNVSTRNRPGPSSKSKTMLLPHTGPWTSDMMKPYMVLTLDSKAFLNFDNVPKLGAGESIVSWYRRFVSFALATGVYVPPYESLDKAHEMGIWWLDIPRDKRMMRPAMSSLIHEVLIFAGVFPDDSTEHSIVTSIAAADSYRALHEIIIPHRRALTTIGSRR